MGGRRRQRNRWQVERYVTILRPKLERQTGGIISLAELGQPESSPPLTDNQLDLVDHPDNVDASRALAPIFEEMIDSEDERHWLYEVLAIAGLRNPDPSSVGRWRAGETTEDKQFAMLFERALDYVVDRLIELYPDYEMHVAIDPADEPSRSLKAAASKDREASRRAQHAAAHHIRYEMFLEIQKRYPEANRRAAKALMSEKEDRSVPSIERSIRFCEQDEWPDGTPVEPRFRWREEKEGDVS